MYMVDTDIVSEGRKRGKANPGVRRFFANAHAKGDALYLSVVTVGEIRRGIESIRHRGDSRQADRLEAWLATVLNDFADHILDFAHDEAQVQEHKPHGVARRGLRIDVAPGEA